MVVARIKNINMGPCPCCCPYNICGLSQICIQAHANPSGLAVGPPRLLTLGSGPEINKGVCYYRDADRDRVADPVTADSPDYSININAGATSWFVNIWYGSGSTKCTSFGSRTIAAISCSPSLSQTFDIENVFGPSLCGFIYLNATVTAGPCPVYGMAPMAAGPTMMATARAPDAPPEAPTARTAVVTLAVGQKGRDLLAVSGPLMRAAAKRWGSDFRVIGGDDTGFAIGEKLRLADYLRLYDRVFYVDADALILPTAPNPFEVMPAGKAYAHDDMRRLKRLGKDTAWIDDQTREICDSQGWEHGGPFATYWNSGAWLLDAKHAPAFDAPLRPYPVWHCSEQHVVNHNLRAMGFEVREFGRAWNWQWWIDQGMAHTDGVHVMHFSGMAPLNSGDKEHQARLALMRKSATRPACRHLGEPVLNAEAGRIGLSTLRTWRPCALNHGKAGHVCGCDPSATCAGCPDYSPPE